MTTPVIEEHDPRTLLVDMNVPGREDIDPNLVASIKDVGLLQPPVGYRTTDGQIRVRVGHRRTLHSIEAGLATVPVIVVGDERTDKKADIERILSQHAENKYRTPPNAAQEAYQAAQLLDLGVSAATVAKRMRMDKTQVAAARQVAASPAASQAAANGLDLIQSAEVAEFEGDDEAVAALVEAAADGDVYFKRQLEHQRTERTEREAIAARRAELEAAGIKTTEDDMPWQQAVRQLTDAKGKRLDEEAHQTCPGHVVHLDYRSWFATPIVETAYCTDPEANGHKAVNNGGSGQPAEDRKAQVQESKRNNKQWRLAETVRRAWLREFLTRKELPKGGLRFIIESLADGGRHLRQGMETAHETAREFMGIEQAKTRWDENASKGLLDAIGKATDQRAQVIALGMILGAYEGSTYVDMWKNPTSHGETAQYFRQLVTWGFQLSDIEQCIVDGKKPAVPAEAA